MNCGYPEERIALFVEGDLPPRQAEDVERHLQRCGECRDIAQSFRETLSELKALAHSASDPGGCEDIHYRVAEALQKQESSPDLKVGLFQIERALFAGLRSRQALACAASVLAVALVLAMPWRSKTPESTPADAPRFSAAGGVKSLPPLAARVPLSTVEQESALTVLPAASTASPPVETAISAGSPVVDAVPPVQVMVKMLTDDPNVVIYWFVESGGSDVSSF